MKMEEIIQNIIDRSPDPAYIQFYPLCRSFTLDGSFSAEELLELATEALRQPVTQFSPDGEELEVMCSGPMPDFLINKNLPEIPCDEY